MKKEVFKLKGMHCASCAMNIQKALSKLPGVNKAEANFGSETALIEYDEEKVAPKDLAKTVSDVGYKLETELPFMEAKVKMRTKSSSPNIFIRSICSPYLSSKTINF